MLWIEKDVRLVISKLLEPGANLARMLKVLRENPENIFCIDLDIWRIPSIFQYSMSHSLRVLTRPLADVSAPKHTAIFARFHFVICGLFYIIQFVKA